LDYA